MVCSPNRKNSATERLGCFRCRDENVSRGRVSGHRSGPRIESGTESGPWPHWHSGVTQTICALRSIVMASSDESAEARPWMLRAFQATCGMTLGGNRSSLLHGNGIVGTYFYDADNG